MVMELFTGLNQWTSGCCSDSIFLHETQASQASDAASWQFTSLANSFASFDLPVPSLPTNTYAPESLSAS